MNMTVGLTICVIACAAAGWSGIRALWRPTRPWSPMWTTVLAVSIVSWIVGGLVVWGFGGGAPARPGVFTGYAATAVGLIVLAVPWSGRLGARTAAVARMIALLLVAFTCWRTESMWLGQVR